MAVCEEACGTCAVCKYVRTVCVTVVVCVWCRGLPLLLCLGDSEGTESLSWISLVMSCTAWAIRELSLPLSFSFSFSFSLCLSPFLSSSLSLVSVIFSFLQAAGLGEELSRLLKEVSVTGVLKGLGHTRPTDS